MDSQPLSVIINYLMKRKKLLGSINNSKENICEINKI
jgi:hypothetical protein